MLQLSRAHNARHLVERHFMTIKCNYDTRAHRINGKWKWILRVIIVQPLWSFNAASLLGLHTIKYRFRNESGHNVAAYTHSLFVSRSMAYHARSSMPPCSQCDFLMLFSSRILMTAVCFSQLFPFQFPFILASLQKQQVYTTRLPMQREKKRKLTQICFPLTRSLYFSFSHTFSLSASFRFGCFLVGIIKICVHLFRAIFLYSYCCNWSHCIRIVFLFFFCR